MRHGLHASNRFIIQQGWGTATKWAVSAGPTPFLYVSLGDQGCWQPVASDSASIGISPQSPQIVIGLVAAWHLVVLLVVAVWFHGTSGGARPIIGLVKRPINWPKATLNRNPLQANLETQRLGERFNRDAPIGLRQSRQVHGQTLLSGAAPRI